MSENFLNDKLFSNFEKSEKIFLQTENRKYSFKEFNQLCNKIANFLLDSKIRENYRVLVKLEKSVICLAIYIATIRAGCIYVPVNTSYTAAEVDYFIVNSQPSLFISNYESIKNISNKNIKTAQLENDLSGPFLEKVQSQKDIFEPIKRDKDDIASILYTSGTTGRSKGAMLTHNNLVSNTKSLLKIWKFSDKDVLLHALPIYHIHGLFVAFNICILSGAKINFIEKFEIEKVIEKLPISTVMMGVPTYYTRLLQSQNLNHSLTKNIRLFISGSAPLLSETHKEFEKKTGHKILERYGMTETNMNTSNPYDGERKPGTVGFPLPGINVRITDPKNGEKLGIDKIGMIEIKGDNVFSGYWKMKKQTNDSFTKDGFFVTGDLGKFTADGYLSIIGRDKDLIISGGLNVYPKEVELLLDQNPNVKESAVIGVPHRDFGEAVVAVIVGNDKKDLEIEIIGSIKNKLANFKQPKKIILIPELPRNAMGKVQKQKLRSTYNKLFD